MLILPLPGASTKSRMIQKPDFRKKMGSGVARDFMLRGEAVHRPLEKVEAVRRDPSMRFGFGRGLPLERSTRRR